MIDSKKVLYSKGKNDENYTPAFAVKPILQYIPKGSVIWCPFDKVDSQFVEVISDAGFDVCFSHIDDPAGGDFFNYEPEDHWDIIISNPPFTGKKLIFERAMSFGKPFALMMTNTWLNDSAPKKLFMDTDLQLLMFDSRIDFSGENKITFSTSYFCSGFLPKQIVMAELPRQPRRAS